MKKRRFVSAVAVVLLLLVDQNDNGFEVNTMRDIIDQTHLDIS